VSGVISGFHTLTHNDRKNQRGKTSSDAGATHSRMSAPALCQYGERCNRKTCKRGHPNGRVNFPQERAPGGPAASSASSSSTSNRAAASTSSSSASTSSSAPAATSVSLDPSIFIDQREAAAVTCAICTDICVQPLSLPCSHLFCESCLRSLPVPRTCPQCRISLDLTSAVVNQFVVSRIENMQITCPLQVDGCIAKLTPGKDHRNIRSHVCEMKPLTAADIDVVAMFHEVKALRQKVQSVEKERDELKTRVDELDSNSSFMFAAIKTKVQEMTAMKERQRISEKEVQQKLDLFRSDVQRKDAARDRLFALLNEQVIGLCTRPSISEKEMQQKLEKLRSDFEKMDADWQQHQARHPHSNPSQGSEKVTVRLRKQLNQLAFQMEDVSRGTSLSSDQCALLQVSPQGDELLFA
jgi:hypothetical protein